MFATRRACSCRPVWRSASGSTAGSRGCKMATRAIDASGREPQHDFTNRLSTEQSPYLLQHAHNPVDWYPWGEDAFGKAKAEDKPIFLSVGYATCHWCHVMERESFENVQTAELLNKSFVSIKVDREERPDVDKVYMTYVQALTGGGGWPMSVWLTPTLEPFYAGTYYPGKDMFGMPSFSTVLNRIGQLWKEKKESIKEQGARDLEGIRAALESSSASGTDMQLDVQQALSCVDSCAAQLKSRFDVEWGGFGSAPKFPRPSEINLLLMAYLKSKIHEGEIKEQDIRHMAMFTLSKMASGGIYDHVGGGFHRYSVDELWHVPHFEKMTYDNPQIVLTYLRALQLSSDAIFVKTVRGVLDYLRRDMTHPEGGIYSAEDADSYDSQSGASKEGSFYLWTTAEVRDVLSNDLAELFISHYHLKDEGNCTLSQRSDPHHEFGGKNVPIELHSVEETATRFGVGAREAEERLGSARQMLHAARAQRPRPSLDYKVVTGWNGMAMSAFANASTILCDDATPTVFPVDKRPTEQYLQAAVHIGDFILEHLFDAERKELRRNFSKAPSSVPGFADDYALLIQGLLDLYEVGGGLKWLKVAIDLQLTMDQLFYDNDKGAYYQAQGDDSIKLRMKDDYDGAEPSANSIAVTNLMRLSGLLPGHACAQDWTNRADQTLSYFADRLANLALTMPQMCCAAYLKTRLPFRQVIVAGCRSQENESKAILKSVHKYYVPDKVVILVDVNDDEEAQFWETNNVEAWKMVSQYYEKSNTSKDKAVAFVCQNYICQAPTEEPLKVEAYMEGTGKKRSTVALSTVPFEV